MPQAPADRHLHRFKDCLPTRAEQTRRLMPTQPPRPNGQKPLEAARRTLLPTSPGNSLDSNAARRAVHPSRRVDQPHQKSPQRYMLEATGCQVIVRRASLATDRTDRTTPSPRSNRDVDTSMGVVMPNGFLVNKTSVTFHCVEDNLEVHPDPSQLGITKSLLTPSCTARRRDALLSNKLDLARQQGRIDWVEPGPCINFAPGWRPGPRRAGRLKDRSRSLPSHRFRRRAIKWKFDLKRFLRGEGADPGIQPIAPKKPIPRQLFTADATSEALDELLDDNPDGMLCLVDELASLFRRLGHGSARQRLLSYWSSVSISVNRKSKRVRIKVPHPVVNIVGNMTPDSLDKIQDSRKRDDGLLDRFLFSCPVIELAHIYSDRTVQRATEAEYDALYRRLLEMRESARSEGAVMTLTKDAFKSFQIWTASHRSEINQLTPANKLRGMFTKIEAYCVRFALILHTARIAANETESPHVEEESMRRAIVLAEYFKPRQNSCSVRLTRKVVHSVI